MKTITASEARTHFESVLKDVENGETVVVTRDVQPVARVSPPERDRADVAAAVEELLSLLEGVSIPETLISQYLPGSYERVRDGKVAAKAKPLAIAAVDRVLEDYFTACR